MNRNKLAALLVAVAVGLGLGPALAGSGTVSVTPGSGATYQTIVNGNGYNVGEMGLCDGASALSCATVKPASTAPGSTDTTLVVGLNPVSSLPGGSNVLGGVTQSGGPWTVNLTQVDGIALGAPSAYGTSPGAVNVSGVNAYVTNVPAVSQSGTWNITNVSGTVSLPTGAATSANQPSNPSLTTPAATAGTGTVVMGAVTTAAPTDTTGDSYPISMTTAGQVRVADATVVTALGSPFQAGGSIGNTSFVATQTTAANLNATVVGTGTFAVQATQNGTWTVTQASGPWTINLTQVDGTTLGSPSAYGTSPGAVNVAGVNAYVTNVPAVSQSGTWTSTVTQATAATLNATVVGTGTFVVQAVQSGAWNVSAVPTTSGGLTTYFLQPTASTNSNNVKSSAGQVYWILVENNSAVVNYLRFYNTSSAPTCSSATNMLFQVQIPASTAVGGVNISPPMGVAFSTGIGICVTSGYATTDTTNATATAISLTIGYN